MVEKRQKYKSDAYAAIHETMDALQKVGAISKKTMKDFDKTCLEPVFITSAEIRALREREKVSQPIFAMYLNVTRNIISDWERGVKKPGGPALRLLSIVQKKGLDSLV